MVGGLGRRVASIKLSIMFYRGTTGQYKIMTFPVKSLHPAAEFETFRIVVLRVHISIDSLGSARDEGLSGGGDCSNVRTSHVVLITASLVT